MQARSRKDLAVATCLVACFAINIIITMQLRHAGGVEALWTANAFMMAGFIFLSRPYALLCAAACSAVQITTLLNFNPSYLAAASSTAVNIFESALTAMLVLKLRLVRLTTPGRVATLVFCAILPALLTSGILSATMQMVVSHKHFVEAFLSRFPAKLLGISLALPSILLLAKRNAMPLAKGRELEAAAHYLLFATASALPFLLKSETLRMLMFPAIVFLGLRLGPRAVTFAMMLSCAVIFPLVVFVAKGHVSNDTPLGMQIFLVQAYIAAAFFTGLAASLVAKHQQRLRSLFANRSRSAMRARDRAQAASVAKSEFLATMSHEIRTPLNSIIGFAQILERRGDLPAEAHHQISLIERSGGALLTVVNDILDFSKVEAGRLELDPKPVRLRAVAEEALAIVAGSAERKGLTLSLEVEERGYHLHVVDDHRLRQILLNYLNNAVKFTDAGHIELKLSIGDGPDLDQVRISVVDTGAGVPAQAKERLFKRFSQVDGSISRSHGGSGLGLAICRALAELMGGRVGVDSILGQGSTFWLELELERAEIEEMMEHEEEETEGLAAHILLVDDHPLNRELASTILGLLGCTCDIAKDGREAVEAARLQRYDAILMDVHMPVMDGLAAARAICALPGAGAATPIIAMSADVLPEHVERCRRAGMIDSVGKPINIEALHECLMRWVGRDSSGGLREAA